MTTIYGIRNCDTMKKAFKWLESHNIAYSFHDYKKSGAPRDVVQNAIDTQGWETVLNKRGTTWRNLPDTAKENMTPELALQTALDTPSIIKRPLLIHKDQIVLGYKAPVYEDVFQ